MNEKHRRKGVRKPRTKPGDINIYLVNSSGKGAYRGNKKIRMFQRKSKHCFMVSKCLESPLDSKEIKPVNPKGNQSWIFIWRTDAEAPLFWPPDVKSRLTGKDPDAGKDWGQEEKGASEDNMVGWHHWLNRHEFEQTPRDSEGQENLVCCSPWGHKKLDSIERLNNIYL